MKCNYENCKQEVKEPRVCPKCNVVTYCSMDCRLQDWYFGHQDSCNSSGSFLKDYQDNETLLGKGSFGDVKLVSHKTTGELYALKQLNKKKLVRETPLEVIRREVNIHKSLDHPNIIKLYEEYEDSEYIYLLMEYADGGSLFDQVYRIGNISEQRARKYLHELVGCVQYLHNKGIIHRDIKAENVLLSCNEEVKLCDFGWSIEDHEPRTTFCGTVDYMAPEMVLSKGHSFELDIWALGVLLYEMLHGVSPFNAEKDTQKCEKILKGNISFGKGVSSEAKDLIIKILQEDPINRLPLGQILKHPFMLKMHIGIGTKFNHYIDDFGICEGEVVEFTGQKCRVVFAEVQTEKTLKLEKVNRILEKQSSTKRLEPKPARKLKEDSARDSYLTQQKEEQLFSHLENWVDAPTRKNKKRRNQSGLPKPDYQIDQEVLFLTSEIHEANQVDSGRQAKSAEVPEHLEPSTPAFGTKTFNFEDPQKASASNRTTKEPPPKDSSKKSRERRTQETSFEDSFISIRTYIEEQHSNFYNELEKNWMNGEETSIPDLEFPEITPKPSKSYLDYEVEPMPRLTDIEENEEEFQDSRRKLIERKRELERLIGKVEGNEMPFSPFAQKRKPEKTGFFNWLGRIIGCGDR